MTDPFYGRRLSSINRAIRQAWVDGLFNLPTAFDNETFEPPGGPYASLAIEQGQATISTLGDSGTDEVQGLIDIILNYPVGQGSGYAEEKADEIYNYFIKGKRFSHEGVNVVINTSGIRSTASNDTHYQVLYEITYQAFLIRGLV